MLRINKYIAKSGLCSRRAAEELITSGKVKVNGKLVTNLATVINEYNDTVMVNGKKIMLVTRKIYVMLNKPKGCISTVKDDKGRKTIMDYLQDFEKEKVFPVGRLDYDTEGLILITNDGDFANKLTQPSSEVPKTYIANVEGGIEKEDLDTLRDGIILDGVKLNKSRIKVLKFENNITRLEITILEGKNRQIHRMFESIGKQVIFLKRTMIGDLRLGGLSRGAYRYLTPKEVAMLQKY
ncbi:MAG: rRNA pseudouridine synthase [Clostridiales bacterium]|nr:rRNA pseudouridine synthase [Clostridiales bacterium]